jgi:Bacterial capsule synthesis protein PGA_cap
MSTASSPAQPDSRSRRAAARRAQIRRRRAVAIAIIVVFAVVIAAVAARALTGGGGSSGRTPSGTSSPAPSGRGTTTASGPASSTSTAPTSSTTTPATSAAVARKTFTLGWAGDTVPASIDFGLPSDPSILLGGVASILRKPNLMIGNLEGTLTLRTTSKCGASNGSGDCFAFRAPPAYASLLRGAGFDVMNQANNHADDYGSGGLADTKKALAGVGLGEMGLRNEILVRTVNGIRVAMVGFASYTWSSPLNTDAAVTALVKKAATQADVVVVVFHGGAEGAGRTHVPTGHEFAFGEDRGDLRRFARLAIDAGADAVLGSGPHVVRGMESYRGRLVAYSVGNFVGYKTFGQNATTSITAVLELTLRGDGSFVSGTIVPTQLVDPGYAAPDPSQRAITLIRSLSKADFGKRAPRIGSNGQLTLP